MNNRVDKLLEMLQEAIQKEKKLAKKEKQKKKIILKEKKINRADFDHFWEMYPRKVDKGKALNAWNKVLSRKDKDCPTWDEIKTAIQLQLKSDRWKNKTYIPHPTTWINGSRWLDDPAEMKSYNWDSKGSRPDKKMDGGEWYYLNEDGEYYTKSGKLYYD